MNHPDGWQGVILNRLGASWRAISGACDLDADLPPTGGGSHWKVTAPDEEAILTIPAKRPIKPVYIRKLPAMIKRRGDGEAD
jgi:hypothetical protein